jgi:hypothetical protein
MKTCLQNFSNNTNPERYLPHQRRKQKTLVVSRQYFDSMNQFALIISFVCTSAVFGQTQSSKKGLTDSDHSFNLSFTTFNHAEWLFNGSTTYLLTDTSVKVMNTAFGEKNSRTIFSKTLSASENPAITVYNYRLDTLKDFYFNYCVIMTSGDEYFLDVKSSTIKKQIRLHHYYLKQLDDIIQLINSHLPEEYQFSYLTKNEKQDCTLR